MHLQGRDLEPNMQGDDVKLLQQELTKLGFEIPADERGQAVFRQGTRDAVTTFQKKQQLDTTGVVDEKTAAAINRAVDAQPAPAATFVVRGHVTQSDNNPVVGARVRVLAKGVTAAQDKSLSDARSGSDGAYRIEYQPADATSSDVVIEVLAPDKDEVVGRSPLIVGAAADQVVDLAIDSATYPNVPEFAQIESVVDPLLAGVETKALDGSSVSYLTARSGVSPLRIAQYLQARNFATASKVPAEAYYGLLRANLPPHRAALAAQDNGDLAAALQQAAAANIVDPKLAQGTRTSGILEQLNSEAIDGIVGGAALPDGRATVGVFLDVAGLNQQQRRTFATVLQNHAGTDADFWKQLSGPQGLPAATVESLQLTSRLGTLTLNNAPLMRTLKAQVDSASAGGDPLRALTKLGQDDWLTLVRQTTDATGKPIVPLDVTSEDGLEPAAVYARTMARQIEDAYPTATLSARLTANDFDGAASVGAFLTAQPAFELQGQSVRHYLRTNNVTLADDEVRRLEGVQRVFNLAPRYQRQQSVSALLARQVDSAYKVRSLGQRQFAKIFESVLGADATRQIYAAASQQVATASALYAKYAASFDNLALPAIPRLNDGVAALLAANHPSGIDFPTWQGLFGSADACNCEECDSVFGASAYLVAVLKFLRDRGALAKLFARRGEIGTIELNCHNTNTTLPYVDLVNEVLERFLVSSSTPYQTVGDAPALRVHPEHLDPDAYDLLEARVYPWTAPFSLWIEEARGYLRPLGVARHEIMDHFNTTVPADRDTAAWLPIATDMLGLTAPDRTILFDATFRATRWASRAVADLRTVQTLLDTARISYLELRQLLDARFVNSNGDLALDFTVGQGNSAQLTCDLEQVQIPALTGDHLQRIERFTRLRRKLGWSVHELDAALLALGGDISDETLVNLAFLRQLHDRLGAPLLDMASWYADLDTHDWLGDDDEVHPSRYAAVFLNRTVGGDQQLAAFELAALAAGSDTIDAHEAAILAALQIITAEELALIRTRRLTTSTLNLANLSELYRVASMKRALSLSVRDLLDLIDLTAVDPFDRTKIAESVRLADLIDTIEAAQLAIPELVYLLQHVFQPNSRFVPRDTEIRVLLAELRRGLQRVQADFATVPDPSGEVTARMLGIVVPPADLPQVVALLYGIASGNEVPADPAAFLDRAFTPFMPDAGARAAAIKQLTDTNDAGFLKPELQQAERFALVLEPLAAYLRRVNTDALVKQKFADFLDIELGASDQLLGGLVRSVADPAQTASALFVDPAFLGSTADVTASAFPNQFAMVTRLHKVAMLVSRLGIPTDELAWVFGNAARLGWLDFNALPLAVESGAARFGQWLATAQAAAFRDALPDGTPTLYELLRQAQAGGDAAAFDTFLGALANRARWNRADLDTLVASAHLNLDDFGADWGGDRTVRDLLRLQQCFQDLRQLGVSAELAWGWTAEAVTQATSSEIKQAARAKYTESEWLTVAEPIRDDLRRQQRAALVDAIINQINDPHIRDTNDLFGYFLMDVEMNPCMSTSRIVFAMGAVQLFVQRCLMHLEPDVELTSADAAMWAWMKNYRMWEAAVQVFVSPENWIEPELRLEKSSFFAELENELLQNDVTDETAELAYQHYLERLDDVARLEVVGAWNDTETKTLHVVARTRGTPHKYFYRQWYQSRRWTPWEEVPIEIEGETATPVIYNRRLYLFWFTSLVLAVEEVPGNDSGERPNRYLQIRLGWSQFRQRQWSPKRISSVVVETSPGRTNKETLLDPAGYRPRAVIRPDGDLVVAVERSSGDSGKTFLDSNRFSTPSNFLFVHDGLVQLTDFDATSGQTEVPAALELTRSWGAHYAAPGSLPLRLRGYDGSYQTVFDVTPVDSLLTVPLQDTPYTSSSPCFFEDRDRSYFVTTRHVFGPRRIDVTPEKPPVQIVIDPTRYIQVQDILEGIRPGRGVTDPSPIRPVEAGAGSVIRSDTVGALDRAVFTAPTLNVLTGGAPIAASGFGEVRALSATNVTLGNPLTLAPSFATTRVGVAGAPMQLSDELVVANGVMGLATQPGIWGIGFSQYRRTMYAFHSFYHPYVDLLIKQLNRDGVAGILDPLEYGEANDLRRQLTVETPADRFTTRYDTGDRFDGTSVPVEEFDFAYGTAYSIYNWELFFHVPFLIANHLSQNQRFDEAQKWFHYIFDPTDNSDVPAEMDAYRFWKIKPFYLDTTIQTIEQMLRLLSSDDPADQEMREQLEGQIRDWRENPFQPHLIAEQRPVAYQKAIVMRYLDNLIAWGDNLFRQDTMESVNEATQLYVLASELLGARPERVPPPEGSRTLNGQLVRTFNDLAPHLDELGNALVRLENEVGSTALVQPDGSTPDLPPEPPVHEIVGSTLFFCVPRNEKLVGYWDTVADRLFKIRNCMNIEGVERQLALFAPPIDPALLVRAAAAGVDLSSVLNDLNAPRPHYRFSVTLQRALELASEVRQLGNALLQALEKRDAEDLALLRQANERDLHQAVKLVRQKQIDDAQEALNGLKRNLDAARTRHAFHANRKARIPNETLQLKKMESSMIFDAVAQGYATVGSALALIPDFDIGAEGGFSSPVAKASFGGKNLSAVANLYKELYSLLALVERYQSQRAAVLAGFDRRQEEWGFSAGQADLDSKALERQVAAADIRLAVARQELKNTELQIDQAARVDELMRSKFTSTTLFSWMVTQLSTAYFQSYQLAYDMAQRAEKAYQHELAEYDASFVRFGYWDSLKKGLLAGDRLALDLRRIESAYYANNKRELELTRHVSLAQIDPAALIQLRETGTCELEIPEALFNLDYPGHYLRRLKSVGLSIPCVTGPYTGVNCTLTLLGNRIRVTTTDPHLAYTGVDDARFITNLGGIQSIATSSGQNDGGLFEINLRDERYLPFEGAGAISRWRLELTSEFRAFDYDTIADVVLHLRYTARDGGAAVRQKVVPALTDRINEIVNATAETGLYQFSSLRHDYPTEFHRFLHPTGAADHETTLTLSRDRFPYLFTGRDLSIERVVVLLKLRDPSLYDTAHPLTLELTRADGSPSSVALDAAPAEFGGLPRAEYLDLTGGLAADEQWTLHTTAAAVSALPADLWRSVTIDGTAVPRLRPEAIEDIGLLMRYKVG